MKRVILVAVSILVLALLLFFFGVFKPKCTTDACFNENLKSCSPVKYDRMQNNNLYRYTISRSLGSTCTLHVKNKKIAIGSDIDFKNLLEKRAMKCKIPKSDLKDMEIGNMKNLLNYCTGPLKEGMYELLLKKMYALVVTQMAGIVSEAEKVLIKV